MDDELEELIKKRDLLVKQFCISFLEIEEKGIGYKKNEG